MADYQLKIADLYNISMGNVNKNYCLTFLIKKTCDSLRKITTLLKKRIEAKKMNHMLEFNKSQWLKQYV